MRNTLFALVTAAVATSPARSQTPAATSARIDSALTALAAQGFTGVVRVEAPGMPVLEKGYGVANRTTGARFTPTTVVQIGSNTKDFTLVALLQLFERGRLGINDSIGKYFPSAPADKRGITVWQLVTHRGGFPIGLGGDFEPLDRAALIDRAMKRPLSFQPGTQESYSNTGYSLLAAIIEQLSGVTYDEYVRDNILKPLGMTSTGLLLPKFDERRLAHGYRAGVDQGTMVSRPHAADGPYWNLRGNGGMLSTVGDMHTFYTALFTTSKLLKPETRRLRFDVDQPIGLAGSDLVCSFLYERLPVRRIEIIVASNTSEWPERRVRSAIAGVLGLPSTDGPVATSAPKTDVHAPNPATAKMLHAFIDAVNSGDRSTLSTFISSNFSSDANSPTLDARVERMLTMHGNLGKLTVVTLDQVEPELVEISVRTSADEPATIKAQVDAATGKIRGIQVLVG